MKITEEQEREYLNNDGQLCVHCESDDLRRNVVRAPTQPVLYDSIECGNCGETWTDIYRLDGIVEASPMSVGKDEEESE